MIDSLIEVATLVPLFHINLLPDLIQVNFRDLTTSVAPTLVHLALAFAAAKDEGTLMTVKDAMTNEIRIFLMARRYRLFGSLARQEAIVFINVNSSKEFLRNDQSIWIIQELRLASAFLCRNVALNQRRFDLHLGKVARLLVRLALAFDLQHSSNSLQRSK